jgi:hypothetical protein
VEWFLWQLHPMQQPESSLGYVAVTSSFMVNRAVVPEVPPNGLKQPGAESRESGLYWAHRGYS